MQNLRIKLILIIILVVVITIGVLLFRQWLEREKQLAIIRENFTRCQNLEDLVTSIMQPLVPGRKSSLDCLGAHDIYLCNLTGNEEKKQLCEEVFYTFKAAKENNLDYCKKTGNGKLLCEALLKKDESLCEELETSSSSLMFRSCRAVIKEDINECKDLEEMETQECKNNFYILSAILKKDIEICDKATYKRAAKICRGILDINECLKYRTEIECPEIYLPQIAKLTKDPSECEKIPYKDDDMGISLYQMCLNNAK